MSQHCEAFCLTAVSEMNVLSSDHCSFRVVAAKRTSSIKSRKVSMQSLQSVRIEETDGSGVEGSDDVQSPPPCHPPDHPGGGGGGGGGGGSGGTPGTHAEYSTGDGDEHDYCTYLPWVKVSTSSSPHLASVLCTSQTPMECIEHTTAHTCPG